MSAADVPGLLRFLTQDAKVPLAAAISHVKSMQTAGLTSTASLASSDLPNLEKIFSSEDGKLAKQVQSAAKRVLKRANTDGTPATPSKKRKRAASPSAGHEMTPAELEASLELPKAVYDEAVLQKTIIYTNRAPLYLAFALTLLKYTLPKQPLSARLSLAQGLVSVGARARAIDLGIEKGRTAEDEGWGKGQPTVCVMGKDICVMKRMGYAVADPIEGDTSDKKQVTPAEELQSTATQELDTSEAIQEEDPPLWAVDLEALKKSNTTAVPSTRRSNTSGLPIHTPQGARSYLLKAFARAPSGDSSKLPDEEASAERRMLGRLLGALEMLFESWAATLGPDELDRRAWPWYVSVRPEVQHGAAGWGGKGDLRLENILHLRRKG